MSVESNNSENGQQQFGEDLVKKINSLNSSVSSIFGLGIIGIIDWVFKLIYSQSSEKWYKISERYFFSYNYRKIVYLLLVYLLFMIAFFLVSEVFIKKHRNDNEWLKKLSLGSNIFYQLMLIIFISYLIAFQFWYVPLINISLVIAYNIFEYLEITWWRNLMITIIIIFFVINVFIVISSFKSRNYELTTIESKDKIQKKVVVLSEYQGKYLVVPYLKKNEVLEMQENKLVYNINEKKSTCNKEYCFLTGSYEFIDKFDYIFKTERINKENIAIEPTELKYISQNQKKDGTTEIEENKDNKDIKNKPSENEEKDTTICFIIDKNCKIKCCNTNKK